MDFDWTHAGPTVLAAFLASLVEFVEALTVVLAVGAVRGWRGALGGTGLALLVLLANVAVLGPALTRIPLDVVRLGVGTLLLLFGMRAAQGDPALGRGGPAARRGGAVRQGDRLPARPGRLRCSLGRGLGLRGGRHGVQDHGGRGHRGGVHRGRHGRGRRRPAGSGQPGCCGGLGAGGGPWPHAAPPRGDHPGEQPSNSRWGCCCARSAPSGSARAWALPGQATTCPSRR